MIVYVINVFVLLWLSNCVKSAIALQVALRLWSVMAWEVVCVRETWRVRNVPSANQDSLTWKLIM